jgi:hypothetical protein
MKRTLVVLAAGVIVVGGATAALAHPRDPAKREAAKACLDQARQAHPDADRQELRDAAKPCLEAAGINVPDPTPEQRARREAFRKCAEDARQAHPDDREARREQVRKCLSDAGIKPPSSARSSVPSGRPSGSARARCAQSTPTPAATSCAT